jgi:hypothetical protein
MCRGNGQSGVMVRVLDGAKNGNLEAGVVMRRGRERVEW